MANEPETYDRFLPNTRYDGAIVIASVVVNDTDYEHFVWTLLLLQTEAPYYRIVEVMGDKKTIIDDYPNIVPAVEAYQQQGGDY